MTDDILALMCEWDKAFKVACAQNTSSTWKFAGTMRSKIAKGLRAAKRQYILGQITAVNGDGRKLWALFPKGGIRAIIGDTWRLPRSPLITYIVQAIAPPHSCHCRSPVNTYLALDSPLRGRCCCCLASTNVQVYLICIGLAYTFAISYWAFIC